MNDIGGAIARIERNLEKETLRSIADKILNGEIETCWICGKHQPHSNAECQAEYEAKLMAEDKNKIPFAWCG